MDAQQSVCAGLELQGETHQYGRAGTTDLCYGLGSEGKALEGEPGAVCDRVAAWQKYPEGHLDR